MGTPKIYADFQNLDDYNRLRLTCAGTLQDLERHGIQLHEGLVLTFYTDDADDHDQPDELRVEGVVHYDEEGQRWVATVDWAAIRHASDEGSQDPEQSDASDAMPISAPLMEIKN
jgi:hypothetical protein